MRYIKTFESDSYKDPIDVESDVIEFRKNFIENSKFQKYNRNTAYLDRLEGVLNDLVRQNPTMTDDWNIYDVYNSDDYGRKEKTVIYVKAVSRMHARVKAANILNNMEIVATGFYDSSVVDKAEYKARIGALEKQLDQLRNIV
jgi:hypothetical protein